MATVCSGGSLLDLDCNYFGGTCTVGDAGTGSVGPCRLPSMDCTSGTSPDLCNGTMLMACVNGHYQGFDCTSIGLRTCALRDAGGPACIM
jgi:hypothetical protein